MPPNDKKSHKVQLQFDPKKRIGPREAESQNCAASCGGPSSPFLPCFNFVFSEKLHAQRMSCDPSSTSKLNCVFATVSEIKVSLFELYSRFILSSFFESLKS
jgi:hypothetical protein